MNDLKYFSSGSVNIWFLDALKICGLNPIEFSFSNQSGSNTNSILDSAPGRSVISTQYKLLEHSVILTTSRGSAVVEVPPPNIYKQSP